MLARGGDRRVVYRLARDAAVLLRQVVHREVNAGKLAPGDRQGARSFRAAGEHDRIEAVGDALDRYVDADMRAVMEDHAFAFHLLNAPRDVALLHLESGDAVGDQPAGAGKLLENMRFRAGAR